MTQLGWLNSKLAKWALILPQYNLKFVHQKAVKGKPVADFLTDYIISKSSRVIWRDFQWNYRFNVPLKKWGWQLFSDDDSTTGSEGKIIARVEIMLVSPQIYTDYYKLAASSNDKLC